MKTIEGFVLTLGLALFVACSTATGPQAGGGGNDFPNAALGKKVADNLAGYQNWEQALGAPAAVPGPGAGSCVPLPQVPLTGLGKRTAGGVDSLTWDMSDTATLGVYRLYHVRFDDTATTRDTAVFAWDDFARDTIDDNERIVSLNGLSVATGTDRYSRFQYSDADGDGIIGETQGRFNAARVVWTVGWGRTYVAITDMTVDAGADNDFNRDDDNRILASSVVSLSGSDTLMRYTFSDADGDSVISGKDTDSCLVDMELITNSLGLGAVSARSWSRARFWVFPNDSTQNYPVLWRTVEQLRSGRTTELTVYGPRADSTFYPGDTAVVLLVVRPEPGNVVIVDTTRMAVVLGPVARDSTDDALAGVYSHIVRPDGTGEKDVQFSFTCSPAILDGEEPLAGSISMRIENDDSSVEHLEGAYNADGISAAYTAPNGDGYDVLWDRSGEVIFFSQE